MPFYTATTTWQLVTPGDSNLDEIRGKNVIIQNESASVSVVLAKKFGTGTYSGDGDLTLGPGKAYAADLDYREAIWAKTLASTASLGVIELGIGA